VIDVGWSTGPVTNQEMADTIGAQTKRPIKLSVVPWGLVAFGTGAVDLNPGVRDLGKMFAFFATGKYVADNRAHEELLGPLPTKDDAIRRWAAASERHEHGAGRPLVESTRVRAVSPRERRWGQVRRSVERGIQAAPEPQRRTA
jgi:hypothetical protein